MSAEEVRPLAEVWGEQIAEAIRPLVDAARSLAPVDDESKPGTLYTASVTSPGGITFTASIVVPESAAYPDQLELTETVQMASASMASGFKRADDIRSGRAPF